jgi:hypothetical protein
VLPNPMCAAAKPHPGRDPRIQILREFAESENIYGLQDAEPPLVYFARLTSQCHS